MELRESILIISFLVCINFLFNKVKDFSCNTQSLLHDNLLAKHSFNFLAVFFLLVLFARSSPMTPWWLLVLTLLMYVVFILITRCDYRFLIIFLGIMFVVFFIEADKNYKYSIQKIDDKQKKDLTQIQFYLQCVSLGIVVIGVLVYMGQHSREFKNDWSWTKFWFGVATCANDGVPVKKSIIGDVKSGIKRIAH